MISVIDGVNERVLKIMLLKNGKEVSSLSWTNVLCFIHKILIFYLLNPNRHLRHLKQGIQEFHRKYVLVPADKAANNVVVVCRLHYVNTLKQELDGTRAYLETDTDEVSVVNAHSNNLTVKFSVCVNEGQDKLPKMYWLPKLHKRPYKARFIANSSSCTTTELSKLLTSCLTAIKSHVIRYCETVYETSNKNWFWSIINSGEVLSKLKCRGFRATSLSTYDFSTLYTTLPHNLIKEKLLDLIEWTFKRALKTMIHFIWHVMTERLFSLPLTKVGIHFGHVRMCATPCPISLIIFILDLGPRYTDKLLEF